MAKCELLEKGLKAIRAALTEAEVANLPQIDRREERLEEAAMLLTEATVALLEARDKILASYRTSGNSAPR